ncbi:MAG TPA: hypothetical protein VG500_01395, partial [Gemmatimonadales bacterium]|nr:hypothetical protein [Gemmatimonadales bacterium]
TPRRRNARDLVLRPDDRSLRAGCLLQRAGGDLWTDAPRITERDSNAGRPPRCRPAAPPPRCPAAQLLIST